jgi:hypothetical protein
VSLELWVAVLKYHLLVVLLLNPVIVAPAIQLRYRKTFVNHVYVHLIIRLIVMKVVAVFIRSLFVLVLAVLLLKRKELAMDIMHPNPLPN